MGKNLAHEFTHKSISNISSVFTVGHSPGLAAEGQCWDTSLQFKNLQIPIYYLLCVRQ